MKKRCCRLFGRGGQGRIEIDLAFGRYEIDVGFQSPPLVKGGICREFGACGLRDFRMALPFNKELKEFARELRKNMTDAERRVWTGIRRKQLKGCQFYRQNNIGNYIVDFYCPAAKLIVEVDGGQHYSREGMWKDKVRDAYMVGLGLTVLRSTDRAALENIDAVVEKIYESL
jgi:very-short-patch-repair endonuclease